MDLYSGVLVRTPRRFVTTQWSKVFKAGHGDPLERRKALSELCALYWYPLYGFVRSQGFSAEQAEDLIQGFFARVLEKNDLAVADPRRGRFRAWLLATLKHYMSNEWAHDRAKKRGGDLIQVDREAAERLLCQEPAPGLTPDEAFERRWALKLLRHVLATLREECVSRGNGMLFDKLKGCLTGNRGEPYALIAQEVGKTVDAVNAYAYRLRLRFHELCRQEISRTLGDLEDVDDELRSLVSALRDL